jgi:gluconolactonase
MSRDSSDRKFNNPNDSYADHKGGVYFSASGEFHKLAPSTGAIYYLSKLGELRKVADGIRYSNGVVISKDQAHLYVSEHLGGRVLIFDIQPDGSLNKGRVFLDLRSDLSSSKFSYGQTGPDGLAIDKFGRIYISLYGIGQVHIVDIKKRETVYVLETNLQYLTNVELVEGGAKIVITGSIINDRQPFNGKVLIVPNPAFKK